MNAARSLFRNPPLLTFVLVALVWLVAGLTLRGFGAYGHLRYLLELAAVIGIAAAGQTLVILMGGRAAQMLKFGEDGIDAGAAGDLAKAKALAKRATEDWGMGDLSPSPGARDSSDIGWLHAAAAGIL